MTRRLLLAAVTVGLFLLAICWWLTYSIKGLT